MNEVDHIGDEFMEEEKSKPSLASKTVRFSKTQICVTGPDNVWGDARRDKNRNRGQ